MVIIKLPSGSDWYKANWAFRQLAEDTIASAPDDGELKYIMEEAQAFGALFINSMQKDVAAKVINTIRTVAEETLKGKIPGWIRNKPQDAQGQRMYLEAIAELLDLVKKETGGAAQQGSGHGT